jgi:hypothetical protein
MSARIGELFALLALPGARLYISEWSMGSELAKLVSDWQVPPSLAPTLILQPACYNSAGVTARPWFRPKTNRLVLALRDAANRRHAELRWKWLHWQTPEV